MFSAFGNPFHKSSEKPLSEKGLSGVLYYSNKSSRDVAQLADDNRVCANNLMTFGALLGEDLTDVTSKMGHMMIQWSNILMEFSDAMDQYRETLKSIAIKESTLQPGKDQKRKLHEKIEQLQGSLSSMEKVELLQNQLQQLEALTEPEEVDMDNFKRMATREALYILLNGMHAMASKSDIISTFGKYIVDELNIEPIVGEERPRYHGAEKTRRVMEDAKRAIDQWNPDHTKVRRTLTSHHGHNPLIVKQLPPIPISSSINSSPSSSTKSVIAVPPRNVSLEEQNKQFSFYKPDDVVVALNDQVGPVPTTAIKSPVYQPHLSPSVSNSTTSGFSTTNMLNHHHHYQQPGLNQQNLYQFYQHYLPPRSYEEMTLTFSPGAVFRGDGEVEKKHDAGGFVLPSTNPNFNHVPSHSSHSVKSDGAAA